MNTRSLIGVVCLEITVAGRAQTASPAQSTTTAPQDTPYSIISRDANSRVWQRAVYLQDASGQWVTNLHTYTELASGICYQQNGQWLDSVEEIDPAPGGGAQALQAPHRAYFPYDIYSGVIQVVTPDGIPLQSRPMGISLFDGTNSVLIASLTNSIGRIISPNQIIYTNCFTDIPADLLVTYRKSGLECDLVFRSQIPGPQSFGLSTSATRLELLTEFFNTPDPVQTQATSIGGVNNVTLAFGQMQMVRGKAFEIGTPGPASPGMGIPVGKSWTQINGRTFLIEEVSYPLISSQLNTLPALASVAQPTRLRVQAASRRQNLALPPARSTRPATNVMKVAQADFARKSGVVLDYVLLNSDNTNFTFRGDTTYLVSGTFNCYGITTFEGSTVIKYDGTQYNSAVQTWDNVVFSNAPYRPTIFTSRNDNSVGEYTYVSNAPTYYDSVLSIDAADEDILMQNVRFSYTHWGLHPTGASFTLNNGQFVNCSNAFYPEYVPCTLNNVLICGVSNAFGGNEYTINGCQMTIANCGELTTTWGSPSSSSVALTNSLLVNATTNGAVSVTTDHTAITTNWIFQTAGAGNFYLATNSPYRNQGTTNIDPNLLAALQQKTTWPPMLYSNVVFSNNMTLEPYVPRDTNTTGPDLGFHYDPIDYLVTFLWVTNSTLVVTNGAVLAGYNNADLIIDDGAAIASFGSPLAPNWFTRYSCVQEQAVSLGIGGATPGAAYMVSPLYTVNEPAGLFRFTRFSCPADGGYHLNHTAQNFNESYSNLLVQDCEFWSGTNAFSGNNNTIAVLKNNLFARSGINTASSSYTNNSLAISNNLFWNMTFTVRPGGNSNTWYFFNNDFDNCTINTNASSLTSNGYNAYLVNTNVLGSVGVSNIVSTNDIAYETGPLGTFYQSTNSPLINAGSCTGGAAGLYHYTTTTNELPETNSAVDIGYHYVALGTNGLPLDSNGDGIPDYLEDANGNGLVDNGETNWALAILVQPQSLITVVGSGAGFSVVADGIAPISYQWQFNGTNIAGATGSSYTNYPVQLTNAGNYTVVVTNNFGAITSAPALLIVNPLIEFTNFCDASSTIKTNGNAIFTNTSDGCVLELTQAVEAQSGTAFSLIPVVLSSNASFSTFFSFRISGAGGDFPDTDGRPGADGIVFVLQTDTNSLGNDGGSLGFGGISNSVGVEFDTWYNPGTDPVLPNGIGDGNHVGIDTNGSVISVVTQHITDDMNNSNIWYAWIDYNSATSNLEVRVSETNSRPPAPTLTNTIYILNYLGTNRAYVGFSAGTGSDYQQQDILSWQFVSPYNPIGVDTNNVSVSITAPTNLEPFLEMTNVTISATVSKGGGSVTNVAFYGFGTNLPFTVTTTNATNYSLTWSNLAAGNYPVTYYPVTAVATDNHGATTVSQIVIFKVTPTNTPPSVAITYPTNGAAFPPGADITITATVVDTNAPVTNVEFFVNGQDIGGDTTAPYSITKCCWTPGTYVLQATAIDSTGAVGVSAPVTNTIVGDQPTYAGQWDPIFGQQAALLTSYPTNLPASYVGGAYSPYSISSGANGLLAIMGGWTVVTTTDETNWTILDNPSFLYDFGSWAVVYVDGTNVYAGGNPSDGSGSPDPWTESHVYKWNWNTGYWDPVGNGLSVPGTDFVDIMALAQIGGVLYVGGNFTQAGTNTFDTNVQYIAKLDAVSNNWVPVGNGLSNTVYSIASIGNDVYIGGSFTNAGGNTNINYIAKLENGIWTNLGSGLQLTTNFYDQPDFDDSPWTAPVKTMVACGSNLFVGGQFMSAGSDTNAHGVAIWNPSIGWRTLNGGPGEEWANSQFANEDIYYVYSLAVHGDRIFISGEFTNVYDGSQSLQANFVASATWSEAQQRWQWSDLDQGIVWNGNFSTIPTSSTIINGPAPDQYDVYFLAEGGNYYAGSGQIPCGAPDSGGIARWRVGYPQSPTVPIVAITNPVSPAIFTNPPLYIGLFGTARSGYTNINSGSFYVNGTAYPATTGTSNSSALTFTNDWWVSSAGLYLITASATDEGGLTGQSQPSIVNVKSGGPVTAIDDQYTIVEGTLTATLPVLTNDSPSSGLRITNVVRLHNNLGTVTISPNGTYLTYNPLPNVFGTDLFYYTVTDTNGNSDSASVTVNIVKPPSVYITAPIMDPFTTNASSTISVSASSQDWSGVITNTAIYVNGLLIGQNPTNTASSTWLTNAAGFYALTATAVDGNGFANTSAPVTVIITNNSTATNVLTANISDLPTSPTSLGTVQYSIVTSGFFDLQGTASDSNTEDSVSYQVLVHPFQDDETVLANVTPPPLDAMGFHDLGVNGSVTNGNLGTNDFSTLPNGVYDLELIVRGGAGQTNAIASFQLQSNLKIGQFSFSEQDLTLPVNGVPLTVTRTYNSLNPDSGPFGTSWSFALNDMDVQLDDQRQPETIDGNSAFSDEGDSGGTGGGLPEVVNMRTGGNWDVTLTMPDGRRVTFPANYSGGSLGDTISWSSPPGVQATLQMIGDSNLVFGLAGATGLSWEDSRPEMGDGIQPFQYSDVPGWVLTTLANGTQYYITRGSPTNIVTLDPGGSGNEISARVYGPPHLTLIKPVSGDSIVITNTGIFHYDPTGTNLSRSILFDHDSQGRIIALHDPNGGSNGLPAVQYIYDNDNNNLVQVLKLVDANNGIYTTNKYDYNNPNFPHYITSVENGDGIPVARNFYDDSGRLIEVVDANGNTTYFNHSTTNNTDIIVDRLGNTNTYVYDLQGNVTAQTNALGQVTTMAYDANNNKTNQIVYLNGAPYATNSYSYDPVTSLLLSSTDPLNHTTTSAYNSFGEVTNSVDANGNSTTNYYDDNGNLTSTVDALGNTTSNFYSNGLLIGSQDPVGTLTTNFYDSGGNMIATATIAKDGVTILSTNTFAYDLNGNRTNSTVWSRRGGSSWTNATTTYIFDGQNRVIQTTNPDGGTSSTVYNPDGTQQSTTDALGRTNSYVYDYLQHLIQTTYPDGTTTQSSYDANGNRTNSVDQATNATTYVYDALNRVTNTIYADHTTNTTVYDGVGRVAQSIDALGGTTAYDYDAASRQLAVTNALNQVSQYIYDNNGNQTVFIDATNHCTTNVFDKLNRQVQVQYADGTSTFTGFDAAGRKVAETNQDAIVTLFGYDGEGRLIAVTNALGTAQQIATRYQYDESGNETAQIDALNRTNTFAYDDMDRRVLHTMPGGQAEGFTYDYAGNLLYQTNFDGNVISNKYDALNRLTNKSSVFGYNVSFAFSPAGQRTNMTDPSGSTAYLYDARDRLTSKLVSFTGGTNVTLSYGYDANGNVTNIASSTTGGVNLAYSYDPLNRLTNVLANGRAAASYTFDAVGNLEAMRYGNGITNQFQYDPLNRLTNTAWKLNASTLASFYYQLGLTGNRTNLSEAVNGTSRTYGWTYDSLYRLKQETISGGTGGTLSYSFDAVGNRTNRTVTGSLSLTNQSFTFNTNDWLTTDSYDNNGNTIGSSGNSYQFDSLNHLTNVNGGTVRIVYDGDGNRVSKTVGGTTTYYVLDDRNPSGYVQVVEEWTSTGTPSLSRVYNYGLQIISQRQPGASTNYFVFDGSGSSRALTDTAGDVVNAFAFDAYGNLVASNAAPQTFYLYTGEQFDPDLGQYYLRQRSYNSGTGRFWTMDIVIGDNADPLSLHKYLYCQASPINAVDPSGHDMVELMMSTSLGAVLDTMYNTVVTSTGNALTMTIVGVQNHETESAILGNYLKSVAAGAAFGVAVGVAADIAGDLIFGGEAADETVVVEVNGANTAEGSRAFAVVESDTKELMDAAGKAVKSVKQATGASRGPVFGTRVHTAFAKLVKAMGLNSEVSYYKGKVVRYGYPGSVRLDAVKGDVKAPQAVWDLKTGSGRLTPARIQDIRSHLPEGCQDIPIAEIRP